MLLSTDARFLQFQQLMECTTTRTRQDNLVLSVSVVWTRHKSAHGWYWKFTQNKITRRQI